MRCFGCFSVEEIANGNFFEGISRKDVDFPSRKTSMIGIRVIVSCVLVPPDSPDPALGPKSVLSELYAAAVGDELSESLRLRINACLSATLPLIADCYDNPALSCLAKPLRAYIKRHLKSLSHIISLLKWSLGKNWSLTSRRGRRLPSRRNG